MLSKDSKGEQKGHRFRANAVLLLPLKRQMKEGVPWTLKRAQSNCKTIINAV